MKIFKDVFPELPPQWCSEYPVAEMDYRDNTLYIKLIGAAGETEPLRRLLERELEVPRAEITVASPIAPPPIEKKPAAKQKTLFGQPFKGDPVPIPDIDPDCKGVIIVHGSVFNIESRETKAGALLCFDIEDGVDAVRVSSFFANNADFGRAEKPKNLMTMVSEGDYVAVRGKIDYRRSGETDEMYLRPSAIMSAKSPDYRVDDAPVKRVELHLHTNMSDNDGLIRPADLMKSLKAWGHSACAVTDHGVVYSFPKFMTLRKKVFGDAPFKMIYGCEGYLESEYARSAGKQAAHIVVLAATQTGLTNLYKLVSRAHLDHFHYHPRFTRGDLTELRDELIIGSACEAGELFLAVVNGENDEKLREIAEFYDYLEIQPLCNNMYLTRNGKAKDIETLKDFNRKITDIGRKLRKPVCATGDAHFLNPEDEIWRRVMLSAKGMDDGHPLPLYMRTTPEMLEEFAYLGEETAYEVVVTNTNLIADMIGDLRPVKKGGFPPRIEGSEQELRELAERQLIALYGENPPEFMRDRIQQEIEPVIKGGYDVVYIAARRLVQKSLSDGYIVGSRGSVGSSFVAFLAGITEVNALAPHYRCPECRWIEFPETAHACGADMPGKICPNCGTQTIRDGFDIPFATFLGFDADKVPDIDLNFSSEYQAKAHDYTRELFKNVFRAGTISGYEQKNAIGVVLKYCEAHGRQLSTAQKMRLASGIRGVRITSGQHPGGMVLAPDEYDINEFTPVQHAANKKDASITTHFEYHDIEDNLLKLDILGHKDPTTAKWLEDMTGVPVTSVDLGDAGVMSLFTSSKILGYENDKILGPTGAAAIPEFGTGFVRGMLETTKPRTFDELVRISGLSHGTNVWRGNSEDIVKAGTATLREIVCARDDIMLFLIKNGVDPKLSFVIMEAVRKGRGLTAEQEGEMRAHGIPEWYITSCKRIKYLFPKAHAVAYVISAFRIAWYKIHHPLEFYITHFSIRREKDLDADLMLKDKRSLAAMLSESAGDDEGEGKLAEICYEFKLRGFDFLPVDVRYSAAKRLTREGDKHLRLPFTAIGGLGDKAAEQIEQERAKAAFVTVEDLTARVSQLDKTNLEKLRRMGAMGDMPESLQLSMFS